MTKHDILMKYFCPLVGSFLLLGIAAGCTETSHSQPLSTAAAAVNTCNIERLTNLYSAFQFNDYGPGPKDEAEFRQFIKDVMGPTHLKLMQIDPDNIDAVFISERDHQPFQVKYGVDSGPGAINAVVFEAQGVSGKRQVGFNGGTVKDVGEVEYQSLWDAKPASKTADVPAVDKSADKNTNKPADNTADKPSENAPAKSAVDKSSIDETPKSQPDASK
jgi:hypothetical protein